MKWRRGTRNAASPFGAVLAHAQGPNGTSTIALRSHKTLRPSSLGSTDNRWILPSPNESEGLGDSARLRELLVGCGCAIAARIGNYFITATEQHDGSWSTLLKLAGPIRYH